MILIHTADNHLGCDLYLKMRRFYLDNFEKLIMDTLKIKEENPNEDVGIVFAGDLFDTDNPDMEVINLVFNSLRILKNKGVLLFGLFGNHDKWNPKFQMSALNIYGNSYKFKNSLLNDNNDVESLFDAYSYGLPVKYETKDCLIVLQSFLPDIQMLKDNLNKSVEHCVPGKINMLFSHFAMREVFPMLTENISIDDLPTEHFDYVGMGDIHGGKKLEWIKNKCIINYCRATFHTSISDMQSVDPGYNILKINNNKLKIEPIDLYQPKIITVETEEELTEELTDSIVLLKDPKLLYKCYFRCKPIHVKLLMNDDGTITDEETGEVISVSNINEIEKSILNTIEMDEDVRKFIKILLNKNLSDNKRSVIVDDIKHEIELIFGGESETEVVELPKEPPKPIIAEPEIIEEVEKTAFVKLNNEMEEFNFDV